jgi:hypothetical protein
MLSYVILACQDGNSFERDSRCMRDKVARQHMTSPTPVNNFIMLFAIPHPGPVSVPSRLSLVIQADSAEEMAE